MSIRNNRRSQPDREFQVIWNQERCRFDVCRGGVPTGAHSTGKGVAVGAAIREARKEALSTGHFIVVTSTLDGRRVLEWDGYGER